MTRKEFMTKLAKKRLNWSLKERGMIRARMADRHGRTVYVCPVTSFGPVGSGDYDCMARILGLSTNTTIAIVYAADNDAHANPSVRAELLKACRLV